MAKKKSSFHMGDEFNGSGKKTYLRATQHNTYAPLPQHNVRLTPNFSRFVPVAIGGIPISTEEGTTQEDGVGKATGSVANVSKAAVRKKKNGKGYDVKFEVGKIQLTDGSYLHPKATPEPKTEKDILEDILPKEESVSKLTPEQREQYKIYVSSILGAMNNVIVADADELVSILEEFDILDPNSIMCFLIICAGESGGSVTEIYKEGSDYRREERGVGYIQVTYKDTQKKCLEDLKDMGFYTGKIDANALGYVEELKEMPWAVSAWYWTHEDKPSGDHLNDYVPRMVQESGEMTMGILFTAESFVNGVVADWNTSESTEYKTMNDALHHIARNHIEYLGDAETVELNKTAGKGWYAYHVEEEKWALDVYGYIFRAPNHWGTFEAYYNDVCGIEF